MSDFLKSVICVAVVGAIAIVCIVLIGGNSYQQQTRRLGAYDRCLAAQIEVAKLQGSRFSVPDCRL